MSYQKQVDVDDEGHEEVQEQYAPPAQPYGYVPDQQPVPTYGGYQAGAPPGEFANAGYQQPAAGYQQPVAGYQQPYNAQPAGYGSYQSPPPPPHGHYEYPQYFMQQSVYFHLLDTAMMMESFPKGQNTETCLGPSSLLATSLHV